MFLVSSLFFISRKKPTYNFFQLGIKAFKSRLSNQGFLIFFQPRFSTKTPKKKERDHNKGEEKKI